MSLSLPNTYTWHYSSWSNLSNRQQYQIMSIRQQIFILEQHCFYLDADGIDLHGMHGFICDDQQQVIAYARVYRHQDVYAQSTSIYALSSEQVNALHQKAESTWWIGRVLVIKSHRKQGWAQLLMRNLHTELITQNADYLCLSAQAYLEHFYTKLEYHTLTDPYDDAGIPHVVMVQSIPQEVIHQTFLKSLDTQSDHKESTHSTHIHKLTHIKHLIFDFDGTLFNSTQFYLDCFKKLAQALEEPAPDLFRLQATMNAGLRPQLELFLAHRLADDYDVILENFRLITLAHKAYVEHLYPQVICLLSQLKSHGYQLHICTNSPQDLCQQHLKSLKIEQYFDHVVGGDRGLERKPQTDMLDYLLYTLQIKANETVLIGDSIVDYQAATAIKMPVISVSWGFTSKSELITAQPTYLINAPHELLDLLLSD
jgi:HAD superfamily hydrolase (TIGR01549 family)